VPDLPIAQLREQAPGQQQIHHHPRRKNPDPGLNRAGLGQHRIDHLERHLLGQLAQMTRREPAWRHLDLTCDDRLTHSGAPGDEVRLGGQTSLYRSPAAFTATDTPLTTSKIPLTTRHYG